MTAIAYHEPETTTGALTLGGPAFFSEGGRRERVLILSEAVTRRDEDKVLRSWRAVAFVDEGGAEYEVQASKLEPADAATWLIAGRKYRHIMGAPPLGPYPSVRAAVVEELRGEPLEGVEVRSLSEDQRRHLEEVDRLLADAETLAKEAKANQFGSAARRSRNGEGERQSARRILLELQEEIAAKAADHGTGRYLAELDVLEKGRGGRLDVATDRGGGKRVRIRSRGGLQYAFERGDLDGGKVRGEVLYEVGKLYRDCYERANGVSKPSGGGKASTEGRQLGVAQAIEELATMRGEPKPVKNPDDGTVIYVRCGEAMTRRQRVVLDRVCGQDMTVRATADALKAGVPSIRRALRGGLTLAAENKLWV